MGPRSNIAWVAIPCVGYGVGEQGGGGGAEVGFVGLDEGVLGGDGGRGGGEETGDGDVGRGKWF